MKWNQVFGGAFIGLGLGLFLGGAIVDQTQKWNSASAAGVACCWSWPERWRSGETASRNNLRNLAQIGKRDSMLPQAGDGSNQATC
jgi:hypothetical protein